MFVLNSGVKGLIISRPNIVCIAHDSTMMNMTTYRVSYSKETMAHPTPGRALTTNVRENSVVARIRRTE